MRAQCALLVFFGRLGMVLGQSQPQVYIKTTLAYPDLTPQQATVVKQVVPRIALGDRLRVEGLANDGTVVTSYGRIDSRVWTPEESAPQQRPDGTVLLVSVDVVASLRSARVIDANDGSIIMTCDLGPALVSGCAAGLIAPELCASFDSDGDGCPDSSDPQPLVPETSPPQIQGSVSPSRLWPPNHKLVPIHVSISATDNCTVHPQIRLVSIASSEPAAGPGTGPFLPDIVDATLGVFDTDFSLRAERYASDRIYTIVYEATDLAHNSAQLELTVKVQQH
jgi:hypothetical protein